MRCNPMSVARMLEPSSVKTLSDRSSLHCEDTHRETMRFCLEKYEMIVKFLVASCNGCRPAEVQYPVSSRLRLCQTPEEGLVQKHVHALPPLALLDDRKASRQLAAKLERVFVYCTEAVRDQALLIRCERYVESSIYRLEDVANTNAFLTLHVDVPLERTALKGDGHLDQRLVCGWLVKVGIRQAYPLNTGVS